MNVQRAHDLLGVSEDTPIDAVKKKYLVRSRMMHPDTQHDPLLVEEATRVFQELNEAWEVIQVAERQGTRREPAHTNSLAAQTLDDDTATFVPATSSQSRMSWLLGFAGICLVIMGIEAGLQGGIPYPDACYPWVVVLPFVTGIVLLVRLNASVANRDT